jgi:hypothetical protein
MLPRLLSLYRSEGFSFVSVEQAERDPFYRSDVDPRLPPGPANLEAAMGARHLPLPARALDLSWLDQVCR